LLRWSETPKGIARALEIQYGLRGSLTEMVGQANQAIIEAISAPPKEEVE
jgi:hypothetical protein